MPGRAAVLEQFMEMPPDTWKEVVSELFTLFETQETNSTAVLQLLESSAAPTNDQNTSR